MQLFKFARLGNPAFVKAVAQTSGANAIVLLVQELTSIEQLKDFHPLIDQLMAELPAYTMQGNFSPFEQPATRAQVEVCKHVSHEKLGLAILTFWETFQGLGLPVWGSLVTHLISLAPSSAAVERVFSLFRNKFDKQMYNSKEDYIETSLMLHYNGRTIGPQ